MKSPWSFEEDFIVCDFYLNHISDWRLHLASVMEILRGRGFERDERSVRARIQNYQYLETKTMGLANAAQQSKRIHEVFTRNRANPSAKANVKAHIQGNYFGGSATTSRAFDDEQALAPDLSFLTDTQQNLYKLVFTLPQTPTFKEVLIGFIKQHGFKKNSEVYNACYVKRDTFWAIIHGKNYGVSKRTVMQLCFGLKLTYDEAVILMASAGYAFAPSNLTDVIVSYYLERKIYDIFEVNISLYDSGADLLFQ